MSTNKALQFLDKNDLECSICLEQFTEPKTLDCQHTYCMKCLQTLLETHGDLQCPKCRHVYALKSHDLENLSSNDMINYLLDFVNKIESEKPKTCATCESPPMYNCSECKLYMCAQCIKQHKILPVLKGHQLYTLARNDEDEDGLKCSHHCNKSLELFCTVCNKCACKDCKFVFDCVQNEHKLVSMKIAMEGFNKNVTEIMQNAEELKSKLKAALDVINKNNSDFDYHIRLCKTAVEIQVQSIIKTAQDAGDATMTELEKLLKEKTDDNQKKIKNIDPKLNDLNEILILIKALVNKTPDSTELMRSHEANVTAINDDITKSKLDKTFHKLDTTPKFVASDIVDVLTYMGIGKIVTTNRTYKVGDNDRKISVTKDQMFDVKLSPIDIGRKLNLTAILVNSTGKQLKCDVKYHDSTGEYNIMGTCNMVGDWQMNITAGGNPIEGSPVAISVEALGLVHTISNIHNYKQHRKGDRVTDVMLDTDGCILVSSFSKDLVKFDQTGKYVSRMHVSEASQINRMHRVDDNRIVYSDYQSNGVVLCNNEFKKIRIYGERLLEFPRGLSVNKEARILYATDREFHCVFKFNIDDGKLIEKIGLEGKFQMSQPYDVAVNVDNRLIAVDSEQSYINMFDKKHKLMNVIVKNGQGKGEVYAPHGITTDSDGNLIISSNNKLQLFDKNGVFIKRIDREKDGLDIPWGICVISEKPRRVAVANNGGNNIKIFNY